MVAKTLTDEALIQIRLSSDELDGVTLQELAQSFLRLLSVLIVLLEFSVRLGQLIGKFGKSKPKKSRLKGRMGFWRRVAWLCG